MSVSSLGMSVDAGDSVKLWAKRSEERACLVVEAGESYCEIELDRVHLETLRDHLPDVLAGLDRWAAEDTACEKAEITARRAMDLAAQALDRAMVAEAAGAHELATSLRAAIAETTKEAEAVDAAVRAFGNAAADADDAVDRLIYAVRAAEKELGRLRDDDRPAELATS